MSESAQQHEFVADCFEPNVETMALNVQQQTDCPKSVDPMSNNEREIRHMSDCSQKERLKIRNLDDYRVNRTTGQAPFTGPESQGDND